VAKDKTISLSMEEQMHALLEENKCLKEKLKRYEDVMCDDGETAELWDIHRG
jgi:hypothetical protein